MIFYGFLTSCLEACGNWCHGEGGEKEGRKIFAAGGESIIPSSHSLRLRSNLNLLPKALIGECMLLTTLPKTCHALVGRQLGSHHPWFPSVTNAKPHLSQDWTVPRQDSHTPETNIIYGHCLI